MSIDLWAVDLYQGAWKHPWLGTPCCRQEHRKLLRSREAGQDEVQGNEISIWRSQSTLMWSVAGS